MSEFRGDYTQLEWLQMGVFLIGLPIAAVLGALLGLVGKWKQGRVISAALVGLGSAAMISLTLFVAFLVNHQLVSGERQDELLAQFDSYFSQSFTWSALIFAGFSSLCAAITMRPRDCTQTKNLATISIRQLLLLQLFSFVVLGAWIGMRSAALSRVTFYEREQRKWSTSDWHVFADRQGEPIGLAREFVGKNEGFAEVNAGLRSAISAPWLRQLELSGLDVTERVELGILRESMLLKALSLKFRAGAKIGQPTIAELGRIERLESLYLSDGDFSAVELRPLGQLPDLLTLSVVESTLTPQALSGLSESRSLTDLYLYRIDLRGDGWIELPASLVKLDIDTSVPLRLDEKRLRQLVALEKVRIRSDQLQRADIESLAEIPHLQEIELSDVADPHDLAPLLRLRELRKLTFRGPIKVEQFAQYRDLLLQFSVAPELRSIICRSEMLFEGELPSVSYDWRVSRSPSNPLPEPISKRLRELVEVARQKAIAFQTQVDVIRKERKLEPLQIEFDPFYAPNIFPATVPAKATNATAPGESAP